MKTRSIILIIVLLIFFSGILYLALGSDKKNREFEECLKPYAIDICKERGLNYSYHYVSSFIEDGVFCKEDIRRPKSERFMFIKEELEGCKK